MQFMMSGCVINTDKLQGNPEEFPERTNYKLDNYTSSEEFKHSEIVKNAEDSLGLMAGNVDVFPKSRYNHSIEYLILRSYLQENTLNDIKISFDKGGLTNLVISSRLRENDYKESVYKTFRSLNLFEINIDDDIVKHIDMIEKFIDSDKKKDYKEVFGSHSEYLIELKREGINIDYIIHFTGSDNTGTIDKGELGEMGKGMESIGLINTSSHLNVDLGRDNHEHEEYHRLRKYPFSKTEDSIVLKRDIYESGKVNINLFATIPEFQLYGKDFLTHLLWLIDNTDASSYRSQEDFIKMCKSSKRGKEYYVRVGNKLEKLYYDESMGCFKYSLVISE